MSSVREVLDRDPPALLYHYTNQAGMVGILNNKEIWASHTQYLNDEQEFRHAIAAVGRVVGLRQIGDSGGEQADLLKEMSGAVTGIEDANVCVCSFSEAGDVLSQWRAYGGGVSGFALGFSGQFIKEIAQREDWWLVPCVYDDNEQSALIESLIDDVLRETPAQVLMGDSRAKMAGSKLRRYMSRYAPILKHRSFSEEREWRIISRPLDYALPRFGYRPGTSMLIPYYRIPLELKDKPLLEEIVIGPTPHRLESSNSLSGFLKRAGHKSVRIRPSQTPYRNW